MGIIQGNKETWMDGSVDGSGYGYGSVDGSGSGEAD